MKWIGNKNEFEDWSRCEIRCWTLDQY